MAPPVLISSLTRYLWRNTIIIFNRKSVLLLENVTLNNYQLAVNPLLTDSTHTHTVCKQSATVSWQRSANCVIDSSCNSICERRTRFVLQYQDTFAFQASILLFRVSLVWRNKEQQLLLKRWSLLWSSFVMFFKKGTHWLKCFFSSFFSLFPRSSGPRLSGSAETPDSLLY